MSGCARRVEEATCRALTGQSIRWIVPFAPGGGVDIYSRLIEKPFEKILGCEIVIENDSGSGSLVGLKKLSSSAPDGRTLGTMNTPGLLAASFSGQQGVPKVSRAASVLGRLVRTPTIIATGAQSSLKTLDDVFDRARHKPLLCGVTGVSSNGLFNVAVGSSLLAIPVEFVAGYSGNPDAQLAAMRGDVDLISNAYQNLRNGIEAGDLRPLLQISDGSISSDSGLQNVPWLCGSQGYAVRRAKESGRTQEGALEDAAFLAAASEAGTTVVAPPNLPPELLECLRATFDQALRDPELLAFAQTARMPLEPASGQAASAIIADLEPKIARFAPIVRATVEKLNR